MKKGMLYSICLLLVVIGGLNWGLVGLFNFDLVAFLLRPMSLLSRAVYSIVGLAAVGVLFWGFRPQKPAE